MGLGEDAPNPAAAGFALESALNPETPCEAPPNVAEGERFGGDVSLAALKLAGLGWAATGETRVVVVNVVLVCVKADDGILER